MKLARCLGQLDQPENSNTASLVAKPRKYQSRSFFNRLKAAWLVVICSFFVMLAGPAFADPNWTISIEDPGQDGLPAGSTLVYDVEIRNDATNPADVAPATTVTFDVSAGTTFVDGGGLLNCMTLGVSGASVTCDVPSIPASGSLSFMPLVETTVAGTVTLTGTLPGAGDANPSNNSAFQDTTVNAGADIQLELNGPATAASGETVNYSFTATNLGPNVSNGFDITFPAPVGLDNIVVPSNCVLTGSDYVCSIPATVAVGGSVMIDFSGQVSAGDGSNIGISGAVGNADPNDGVSDNNLASTNTSVTAGSDLAITKAVSADTILVGDTATFTISAEFTGDDPNGMLIEDTVPGNYQVVYPIDDSGTPFDCSASAGNLISCSLASAGASGANVSLGDIVFDALVVSESGGTNVVNSAEISAAGPIDPDPTNNISDDGGVDLQDPFVDHQINKSGPNPPLVAVGSTYNFGLSSTNLGNADFFGTIEIVDSVPAGMTITTASGIGWTCTPAGPVVGPADVTCTIVYTEANPLASEATTPVITTAVLVTAEGALANTAQVSSPDGNLEDMNGPNDIITVGSTGLPGGDSPDVTITKSASLATLQAGEIQTFVIEVINTGTLSGALVDAEGVEITDTVANLINNTVAPGGGIDGFSNSINIDQAGTDLACTTSNAGSNGVLFECDISVLPVCTPGSCPTITINARPGGNAATNLSNTAEVITTITADSDETNNSATVTYDLTPQTDVEVEKTAAPSPAVVGQDVLYTITALNRPMVNGVPVVLSTAQNVVVTDDLPDDMTFISVSASGGGTCIATVAVGGTTSGDTLKCSWSSIANNNQQTVDLVLRPNNETLSNPPLSGGTAPSIVNSVSISTDTDETDETNNSASAPIELVEPSFDLIVNKTDDVDPIGVAEPFTYTIAIQNSGPSAAENVTIIDRMPASRIALISVTDPADGTCSITDPGVAGSTGLGNVDTEVTCVIPYLAAGDSSSFQIEAVGDQKGSRLNLVEVSADGSADYESNTGNDTAEQRTTVRSRIDVRVNSKVPSATPVNLGEDFSWNIQVENRTGDPGQFFSEADGVVVSDTLPAGMELTGTPTAAVGETSYVDCTGAAGDTSFSCVVGDLDFATTMVYGTMASGEIVDITVPVRVVTITSDGQSFDNTAEIEATESFEPNTSNNDATGTVVVNAGSISGEIFFDFNDDGLQAGTDTLVNVVTVRLTGTDLNGNPITRTVNTTNGTYLFDLLPQGNYTVTRDPITSENYLDDGHYIPGTGATPVDDATNDGTTVISLIALGGNQDLPDYDFAVVPQARIGLAKDVVGTPSLNADGSFDVPFIFRVENFSLEALNSVEILDPLEGAANLFGTYVASNVTSARGQYTIATPPASGCGGAVAGFTGHSTTTALITGATIAAGTICEITVTLTVYPETPFPSGTPQYENSATVDGVGELSGQTSATNPLLNDISDDGANADSNNDGSGAGESDPTPVNVDFDTTVLLTKSVDTSAFVDPTSPQPGELLTYTYTVTNPSDFNVFDITVAENPPGAATTGGQPAFSGTGTPPVVGAPSGGSDIDLDGDAIDLAPNSSITYTATYAITQADIDAGFVENTATLTATDVYGEPLNDLSDDPVVGGEDYNGDSIPDDPTVALLPSNPVLDVEKSAVVGAIQADGTFDVTYTLVTTNTGNVTLDNLTLVDDLNSQFGAGVVDAVTSQPTVTVQPTLSGSVDVTDTGTTYAGGATPLIGATGTLAVGDSFTVTFAVRLKPIGGTPVQLANTATATATPPATTDDPTPTAVSDNSQNGATTTDDGDPSTPEVSDGIDPTSGDDDVDVPTVISVDLSGGISLVKTAVLNDDDTSGDVNVGDTITYTYVVKNDSTVLNALNVTVSEPNDATNDFTGTGTVPSPAISTDTPNGTTIDVTGALNDLAPGASMSFTATYALTQADIDAGLVENSAVAGATDPFGNALDDVSDNAGGDGTDGVDDAGTGDATGDDNPTLLPLGQLPELTTLKETGATSALNPDGTFTQEFTLTVTNTGNTTISNVTLLDDVEAAFGTAFDPSAVADTTGGVTVGPVVAYTPATSGTGVGPVANASFDGDSGSDAAVIDGTASTLYPGDLFTVTFTVLFDATEMTDGAGDPVATVNTSTVGGTPPG
ncbi:hypothetical protein N9O61_04410, partial [Octadecabacter sp.]|nr:hypothetical protein [Octadecabacter sp.]